MLELNHQRFAFSWYFRIFTVYALTSTPSYCFVIISLKREAEIFVDVGIAMKCNLYSIWTPTSCLTYTEQKKPPNLDIYIDTWNYIWTLWPKKQHNPLHCSYSIYIKFYLCQFTCPKQCTMNIIVLFTYSSTYFELEFQLKQTLVIKKSKRFS